MSQRARIIEAYNENGCSKTNAYRGLRDFFGITNRPTERTILNIDHKFKETGSLKSSVRIRTAESIAAVRKSVHDNPSNLSPCTGIKPHKNYISSDFNKRFEYAFLQNPVNPEIEAFGPFKTT